MRDEKSFGDLLTSLRTGKGTYRGTEWTQIQVARKLGVSRGTYNGWENGKSLPHDDDLENIVKLFNPSQEDEEALYRLKARASPVLHTLPFGRNSLFTGRQGLIKRLGQLLQENGSVAINQPVSINGLGGIGKSQLALEYAYRHYEKEYRAVFWVNAADKTTIETDYAKLADRLKLPERNERERDRIVEAVKTWLEGHSKWLLILDNADDLELADSFLPKIHQGHILLTTRSQIIGNIASPIEIEEMEPEEGLVFILLRSRLLRDRTKHDEVASDIRNTAMQLVNLLGGHPLALDQAGAYIEETGASITEYIDLYHEKRHLLLQRRGLLPGEHVEAVTVTFEICFTKACKRHPMAMDILQFCSFLQPDSMPAELFQQDSGLKLNTNSFNEVIAALRCYSLIKWHNQEKTLWMHRLVQAVLVDTMPPEIKQQRREFVLRALNEAFPEEEFRKWSQCERLLPHALICATWAEHELVPKQEASELLRKTGVYLRERGQYTEAESLLTRALVIKKQQLGTEHPETAKSMHNLAVLYRRQSKYGQAESLYQQVVSAYEKHLGPEHPETAAALNDLAVVYYNQSKYELAEKLYKQALTIQNEHLEPEHPRTAWTLNNLATIYYEQGRYDEAEPLFLRAIKIRQKRLGPEHPETAMSLNSLAVLYWRQGKYEQSETLYRQAITIQEKQLGPDHPDIAWTINSLGVLYHHQGKYEKAELLLERAVAIREKRLGPEHPNIAWSLHSLAKLLQDQGKHERAEAFYIRALSIREQQLGTAHPHTQKTRIDYANFLRSLGRDSEVAATESGQTPGQ